MVVLKKLDDALRDGDHVRAVIRNSGVGQDGKTVGIMVPRSAAQLDLIRAVYRQAELNPQHTRYVEAHGTGTIAGDGKSSVINQGSSTLHTNSPLFVGAEIAAIRAAFDSDEPPIHVGSVKPNIGHLESASGIASLIKAILMLENDAIPPALNLVTLKEGVQGNDISVSPMSQRTDCGRAKAFLDGEGQAFRVFMIFPRAKESHVTA